MSVTKVLKLPLQVIRLLEKLFDAGAGAVKSLLKSVIVLVVLGLVGFAIWQVLKPGPPCRATACGAPVLRINQRNSRVRRVRPSS